MAMRYIWAVVILFVAIFARPALGVEIAKSSAPKTYAFELDPEKVRHLEAGLARIRIGDSMQTVKSTMGQPDSENPVYRPQLFGKNVFQFTVFDYVLKRVSLEDDNNFDWRIILYFDKNGRLCAIDRSPSDVGSTVEKVKSCAGSNPP